jgi:MerR family copper efflux transcriptional regulator
LRYYEEVGLIGPVERDPSSRHRRYRDEDLDTLQALACLRATGVGIEDMRTYQANRELGHTAAGEQRDLLLRHVERIGAEIETLRTHLDYLRAKAALWDARDRDDAGAETEANPGARHDSPPEGGAAMSPVLVTGGDGYVGTQLIAALLRDGRRVRATVRSPDREAEVRAAVRRGDADDSGLEVVAAQLIADEGWTVAAAGCEEVHHTAFPMIQTDNPDEVIVPARDGTLRVLRAARDAGARAWC